MINVSDTLNFISWGVEELKPYLLSNELYWPSGARYAMPGKPFTPLTPGNLLLSLKKVKALNVIGKLDSEDQATLESVSHRYQQTKQEWQSAWEKKVEHEFQSRLRLWIDKLDEMGRMGGDLRAYYARAVRERVILGLLAEDVDISNLPESATLQTQDDRLQKITVEDEFIWDRDLEQHLDSQNYWYLYRRPR